MKLPPACWGELHFLFLGAGLFFLAGLLAHPEGEGNKLIVVSPGRIEHLLIGFSRTWQRPPTQQELEGLIKVKKLVTDDLKRPGPSANCINWDPEVQRCKLALFT